MISRLTQLTIRQYLWVLSAYFRLASTKLFLRYASVSWLMRRIQLVEPGLTPPPTAVDQRGLSDTLKQRSEQMHEAVRLAARLHFGQTACLPKSIVLASMLGKKAVVRVGVRKVQELTENPSNRLASHAWVEFHGVAVSEPQRVEHFVQLNANQQ